MQTTDLERSIRYTVPALIEEEGSIVIPEKLLLDIVKQLPEAAVGFETQEGTVSVSCDKSSFVLKTLDPNDFPEFPIVDVDNRISVPFDTFCHMIKRVAKVVSKDQSRAVLTGVLISTSEQSLKMVATDSYRLAVSETEVQGIEEGFEAIVSGAFLQEVASLPKIGDSIEIGLSENQVVLTYQSMVFINRRIEGNFPNYKQLLPDTHALRATIEVDRLVAAVKRASLLGQAASPVRFDINVASQTVQLSAAAQDVGSAQETIPCVCEGEDVEIALNSSYVLEGLSAVETDKVNLDIISSMRPGTFTADGDEDYLYLVMPVRIA